MRRMVYLVAVGASVAVSVCTIAAQTRYAREHAGADGATQMINAANSCTAGSPCTILTDTQVPNTGGTDWHDPKGPTGYPSPTVYVDLRHGLQITSYGGYRQGAIANANYVSPFWIKTYPQTHGGTDHVDGGLIVQACLNGQGAKPECSAGDNRRDYNTTTQFLAVVDNEDPDNTSYNNAASAICRIGQGSTQQSLRGSCQTFEAVLGNTVADPNPFADGNPSSASDWQWEGLLSLTGATAKGGVGLSIAAGNGQSWQRGILIHQWNYAGLHIKNDLSGAAKNWGIVREDTAGTAGFCDLWTANAGATSSLPGGFGGSTTEWSDCMAGNTHTRTFADSKGHNHLQMAESQPGIQIGAAAAFSSLPICTARVEGSMTPVTDSITNTWGATVTGWGNNHVLAYCDGTNWTVMAK